MTKCSLSSPVRVLTCVVVAVTCLGLISPAFAAGPAAQSAPSGPKIWLQDNRPLPVNHVGSAASLMQAGSGASQPVAMASGDIDGDGIADLVVGYSSGVIAVHRGNLDAFAPQSDESFQAIGRGEFPAPFLPDAKTFAVPVSPDFIALGNFTGNGNQDLVIAARGGSALYLFAGDGKGNFAAPQTVNLAGPVTTLAGGDLGISAEFTRLLVGVGSVRTGFSLQVYSGTAQGFKSIKSYPLPAAASNVNFGEFEAGHSDAALIAGGQVFILRSSSMQLVRASLPVSGAGLALGSFVADRVPGLQIAVLGSDGSVQIAAHNEFDPRPYTLEEGKAARQAVRLRTDPNPMVPVKAFPANGWKIVESFPSVGAVGAGQSPVFFRTRVSSNGSDDIMWLSAASGQMVVISHANAEPGASTFLPGQVSVRAYAGAPVAALSMRINVDGRPGVMAIHQGETGPSMLMPIPDPTFTVNTTTDLVSGNPNACLNNVAGQCSLRQAIIEANTTVGTDTIMVPAGTYTLTIARNAADHHTSLTGTLEVQDSVNIIGAGQTTTIIQGGTQANLSDSVDKVISFNQDIDAFTLATVHVSNLTIQNGRNRGNCCALQDGFGGAFDYDTGGDAGGTPGSGTASLFLTNVTLNNNAIFDGQGGGFTTFNTTSGSGFATLTNVIIQNNSGTPNASGCCGDGGGGVIDARSKIVMTNVQITNNKVGSGGPAPTHATGGGLFLAGQHTQPQSQIHASIISGNTAAGTGGGIATTATLLIDQGSIISNNIAGSGGANGFGGGGIVNDAFDGLALHKVTITGNSTTGNGGGIFTGDTSGGVPVTMDFSRLTGNSSTLTPASSNLYNLQGTITVTNNWWGTNTPSGTIVTNAGTTNFTPWINLTHTANPNLIRIGDLSTLTADFLHRNTDPLPGPGSLSPSNLDVFSGLPVTFNNNLHGTITNAQPFIESRVNISTATESGTTVTITTATPHSFTAGQTVTIAGVSDFRYDGQFTVQNPITSNTFSYTATTAGIGAASGGTAGVPAGTATATYTATSGGIDNVHAVVDGFTANAVVTVLFPPSIAKAFTATHISVNPPTTTTLTFTITNPNTANSLNGLAFTDNLPAGLAVANVPNVSNTCGGTVTAAAGSGSISLSGGVVTFNGGGTATCTVAVDVKGLTDGIQNNVSGNITATDAGGLTGNTANKSITVIDPPHINKVFGAASIPLNGTTSLTFTLNSTNTTLTLNGVAFADSLPPGLVVATPGSLTNNCGGTATATDGSTSVSLTGATLAPGVSCTVSVNVQGTTAGLKTNSVTATASDAGGLTGNTSTAALTVVAPPTISKAFNPVASIPLNGTATLTFTIHNPNLTAAGDLTGVAFSDTLPSTTGTLVVAPVPNVSNTCGGTVTATAGTGVISLSGGTVAHNFSCTLSVDVKGTVAGDAANTTGAITSTEGGTGAPSNTAPFAVVAPPTISKAFGAASIPTNGTTTLTFTITNPAANTTAENGVAFSDTLTNGLQVASTPGVSNTCNGTVTAAANTTSISLSGGSIASPGTSCTIVVNVTGTQSGTVSNTTGAVSSTNGGTGATSNTATLTVASPPTISKAFAASTIPLNGTTTLTFTITNPNSNVTLNGVAFTDNVPSGLVVAPTPNVSNTCSGSVTAVAGASSLSLSGGVVNQGTSCTLSVDVQGTTAGAKLNTTGAITSTEGGTGTASNTATLTVVAPPTISKAFNPSGSIPLNGITTLTFTISNPNVTAAGDLTGVAFSDTLPSTTGTLVVAPTPSVSNTCGGSVTATAGTGVISLSGGSVAHNASCTLSVNVQGTTAGDTTNITGAITSTQGGTGTTSNTAPLTVVAPPSIAKAFGAANIPLNGTTSLTFTITNPGANTVAEAGVAFSDALPAGLVVATPNGLSNTCGGTATATAGSSSISLTGGSIAVNSSCTVVVNVTGTTSGIKNNTSGPVSSTNGGTGNTASDSVTVASPPTIQKAFAASPIALNATTTLTFTITNPNSNVTLNGVAFTDNLPAGLVVAPTPNVSNTCSGSVTAVAGASSVSLSGGVVNQGASCTLSVDVQGTTAGVKTNTTGAITSTEGGPGNPSNTAPITVSQATTSTAVSSSSNPAVFGVPVTFTATVTDTSAGSIAQPTGSVQFVVDGVNFGSPVALLGASSSSSTANSQATATLSVTGSPHTVTANYVNVDGNFINSSGSLAGGQTSTVASTSTAVVSSSNPSVFGQPITFTATVTDTSAGSIAQPTGTVQFVVDGVNFGSPVALAGATSTTSTATSGATAALSISGSPHAVTANYLNADGNFTDSNASLSQVVNKANTTTTVVSSLGTITLGDTVTFTATVAPNPPGTGTPTGIVTFFDGATPIGNGKLSGGQTTFPTALLSVGSHSITAIYNGDDDFTAGPLSSPITETVNLRGSTTGVALNPTTVGAGQPSTITATVTDGGASVPPGTPDVFAATGAPATGRTGFTATFFTDGAVVITGGTDANNNVLNSAEFYVGGTFNFTPGHLNTARTGAVAVLLPNGRVLIAGGSSNGAANGAANGALNSAELLDLNTGTFVPTSNNMTAARFGMTATLLNTGKVLLAGGSNSGGVVNSAELYDPVADTFTATGNLNAARTGASATLLGTGKVLIAGGSSNGVASGALSSAEVFDPAGNAGAGSFASVAGANPTLAAGRWQPEAALLLSGKVLVAGGQNAGGVLTTADLYDPAADSFTASSHQMNEARANGSAVALPNGMVLLPGGTTSQSVDLYDADSDKFNLTGNLLHFDDGLVATLLNNGQVLVVGLPSNLEVSPPPSDAELYSPSFNPLGTVGFGSSEPTDVFGAACVLTPSNSTASVCTSTVTPISVATSPHTITGTYPADAVHSGSSNSASLTVVPTAPPTIAKAFSAANVGQNNKVSVSFTIVNPNPAATLTGISFTDALPAGMVVASPNNLNSNCGGTFTALAGSSSISLTGGTVAPAGPPPIRPSKRQTPPSSGPAASGQCVISLDVLVTGTGTISNTTGPVSANESGPGTTSNTASINVVLAPTVSKAFGAASIPVNGTTSLTFNIANPNSAILLAGISLTDTLPSGLVVATPNGLTGSCVGSSSISAGPGSNSISLTGLNLLASGSCSFSVNVTGTSAGTKSNTTAAITGTYDDGSGTFVIVTGGTASATIVVVAPPAISKAFVPPAIAPGGVSALTFTITNPAVNTAAESGVAFTDTLPANVVVATPNGAVGNCNGGTLTAVAGSGSISLTGGTVAAAGTCVFSVNVTSSVPGSYTNTTGAVSSTNGGTGNTASATLSVAHANLSITKSHQGTFSKGQNGAQYTLHVSNAANAGPTVGTVTVVDTLPVISNPHNLVPVSLAGTGWTCTLATLTCTRSDALLPGASYPDITFTVNIPQNITNHFTNTATVSGGGDPNSHTGSDPVNLGGSLTISSADTGTATTPDGTPATFSFNVDATAAPSPLGAIAFGCGNLPVGAVCNFNPPSESLDYATITLTLGTTARPTTASVGPFGSPVYAILFPMLGLAGIVVLPAGRNGKRRKKWLRLVLGLGGMAILLALAGCGGRPVHNSFTPPGTYTITVTAAAGTTTANTTITLTVQ